MTTLWEWSDGSDSYDAAIGTAPSVASGGTYGDRLEWPSTTHAINGPSYIQKDFGVVVRSLRFIYTIASYSAASHSMFQLALADGTQVAKGDLSVTGQVRLRDAAGVQVAQSSETIPTATEVRFEAVMEDGAPVVLSAYRVDDGTQITSIAAFIDTTTARRVRVGNNAILSGTLGAFTVDEVLVTDVATEAGAPGAERPTATLDSFDHDSATISWGAVTDAVSYDVAIFGQPPTNIGNVLTHTFALPPSSDYALLVRTVFAGSLTSEWEAVYVNTLDAPAPDAGPDQVVALGATVNLTGAGYTGPVSWTVEDDGGTDMVTADLTDADTLTPSFVFPSVPGTIVLRMTTADLYDNVLVTGVASGVPAGTWRTSTVTAAAPTGAAYYIDEIEILGSPAADEVHYIDQYATRKGSDATWSPGGLDDVSTVAVDVSDDGLTWTTIAAATPTDGEAVIVDREAPLHTERLYRAVTTAVDGDLTLTSTPSTPVAHTLTGSEWLLSDVNDEATPIAVFVDPSWEPTSHREASTHYTDGADFPVVRQGREQGGQMSLTVKVWDTTERETVESLLSRRTTLLLRSTVAGRRWYLTVTSGRAQPSLRATPRTGEVWKVRDAEQITVQVVETGPPDRPVALSSGAFDGWLVFDGDADSDIVFDGSI